MPAHLLRTQVELCKRTADLPVLGSLGVQHHWLRTPTKEVGMGQPGAGLPGHGEPPPVGLETQWIDHGHEVDKTCEVVLEVDAACVDRETALGASTGRWIPLVNDCHTVTQDVLDRCSTRPSGPSYESPLKTGAGHSL